MSFEHAWIAASVGAAFFQALRYAALKELNQHLSALVTTYVRMLFGLPFLIAHLAIVLSWTGTPVPQTTPRFWMLCAVTAISQVFMTLLVVKLFRLGNFAVGLMLTRADVILTAIIGSVLFSEAINAWGWLAIAITVAGVLAASAGRMAPTAWAGGDVRVIDLVFGPATRVGLTSALCAAVSYLVLREAIHELDPALGPGVRSAAAGVGMTTVSFVLVGLWLLATRRDELLRLRQWPGLCLLAGSASAAGTICWFLAAALTNVSYVAAVTQVQVVFALMFSRYWFKETIRPLELAGMGLILGGVLIFRMV